MNDYTNKVGGWYREPFIQVTQFDLVEADTNLGPSFEFGVHSMIGM